MHSTEKESNKRPTEIATVGLLYPVDCKKTRQEYVKQCRPTWVKHFDRKYCSKKKVQRLLDDNDQSTFSLRIPRSLSCEFPSGREVHCHFHSLIRSNPLVLVDNKFVAILDIDKWFSKVGLW